MRTYQYFHRVLFEETNLVGNVYYANHIKWQGRCREMFLFEHAPDILDLLKSSLALVTIRCGCDYFEEMMPFDEIRVEMTLEELTQTRITLHFDYWRGDALMARGSQQVACMNRTEQGLSVAEVPPSLKSALEAYKKLP